MRRLQLPTISTEALTINGCPRTWDLAEAHECPRTGVVTRDIHDQGTLEGDATGDAVDRGGTEAVLKCVGGAHDTSLLLLLLPPPPCESE